MKTINRKKILAQLSTVHSSNDNYEPEKLKNFLDKVINILRMDTLIIGWEEKPALFENLIEGKKGIADEVFLWYPFLSDFPGFNDSHLTINYKDQKGCGWGGYEGTQVNESFKQACPNNPFVLDTSLNELLKILTKYNFDGVFIDKIRYPSMVNGIDDFLTCFCPHCHEKAKDEGLDLALIQKSLNNNELLNKFKFDQVNDIKKMLNDMTPAFWDFHLFRINSINRVVKLINHEVRNLGKGLSLDVFSPCLASLVGQDYDYMSSVADWIKPMIYRFSNGPASLKSEIPALITELSQFFNIDKANIEKWLISLVPGLTGVSTRELEILPPLEFLFEETLTAVKQLAGTDVFLGLETVNIKGKLEVEPANVKEILDIGEKTNVDGFVISWDLLHTPFENLIPIKDFV